MKIRTKVIAGFSMLLLIMVGITLFGYDRLTRMDSQMNAFYDNRFQKVMIVVSARSEVNISGRVINDMLLGAVEPQKAIEDITARLTGAGKEFKKLGDAAATPSEKQLIEAIKADSGGYGDYLRAFTKLAQQGKLAEARDLYINKGRSVQDIVSKDMDGIVAYEQTALQQEMTAAKAMYRDTVRMVAFFAFLGVLLGMLVLAWVLPSIALGLSQLGRRPTVSPRGG